ncbi:NUDIX domain-containing protein [Sphingomonas sp. MMS24-JH45]
MLIVTGSVTARRDTFDALLAKALAHVRRSRTEDGCLHHEVALDSRIRCGSCSSRSGGIVRRWRRISVSPPRHLRRRDPSRRRRLDRYRHPRGRRRERRPEPVANDPVADAFADPSELPDPIPAATLVVFRDRDGGPPELLMVERAKAMAFAAGAMVFPGGRIDPGDHVLAQALGFADDDGEAAAKIGAIRETIEEAGLPVGLAEVPRCRHARCHARRPPRGTSFGAVLKDAGARLDLDRLVPFARWRPQHRHLRIFDTRFYLARLPAGAPCARVDKTENVRLTWATAASVLADADAGRLTVIYPTRRNLEQLRSSTIMRRRKRMRVPSRCAW